MTKREKLCLDCRNKQGQQNETFCKHFQKKYGAYILDLFFGIKRVFLFFAGVFFTLMAIYLKPESGGLLLSVCKWFAAGLVDFLYIYYIIKGLWYWKYTKHIFVTNEGIWIMALSTFWRYGDFTGKHKFWAPKWSLYSWSELKNVSSEKQKIRDFQDFVEYSVINLLNTKTIYLTRWDGVECVNFLTKADTEKIVDCYKTYKKSKRKKKLENNETSVN